MEEKKMIELSDDALDAVAGGLWAPVNYGSGTPDDPYEVAGEKWAVGDQVRLDCHPVGDIPCKNFWDVRGRIDAIHIETVAVHLNAYLDLTLSCCGAKIYRYSASSCTNLSR